MALYYSNNDALSSVTVSQESFMCFCALHSYLQDVEAMAEKLPNIVEKHLMEDEEWSHADFLTAIDVKQELYDRLLRLLQQY